MQQDQTENTGSDSIDDSHERQAHPTAAASEVQPAADSPDTQNVLQESSPKVSPNNQITTGLIVLIVVLLFVMLMLSINGKLFRSGTNDTDIAALEARNLQLRADINEERARIGLPPLPADDNSARTTAQRLQQDASKLVALVGQWQQELETKDKTIGELKKHVAAQDDHAKYLYNQVSSMQNQLDQSADATSRLATLTNDLKAANQQISNYQAQLIELQGRPSSEEHQQLRQQLNDSIAKTSKLEIQIDGLLESSKNQTDGRIYEEALTEIEKLRETNHAQRYEIQSLRAQMDHSSLFVESDEDLPPGAARLLAKLKTLEEANRQQLEASYESIRKTLDAEIVHRQTFSTGSSKIKFDREKIIQDILDKRGDRQSFFLVVGYASESGGEDSNRKLSERRAVTVASIVNLLKAPDQQVKAVYLGETKRFSPTVEIDNQICEIWEIKG